MYTPPPTLLLYIHTLCSTYTPPATVSIAQCRAATVCFPARAGKPGENFSTVALEYVCARACVCFALAWNRPTGGNVPDSTVEITPLAPGRFSTRPSSPLCFHRLTPSAGWFRAAAASLTDKSIKYRTDRSASISR